MGKEIAEVGTVKIADDVVARIAALAALEVDGVSAMAGNYTSEILEKVSRKNLSKGAKVVVVNGEVKVDLSLMMSYGFNIPATCQQAQTRVKGSIENMTGLTVTDVNIRIAGITMPEA
ncbi:MAG: Asp23/Gls24 family envelope stress response protein [Butyrivibrio sp.]|nr:Asp23/Gls24 family envelope stress response protein [Butyrivibrio sp.]